ncbi:hypothetical protein J4470_04755, partial [Candidatus Woesearchaeota archaeon]|nr:hypothetical protein [Candidatus Woesearchaeota archaeon]
IRASAIDELGVSLEDGIATDLDLDNTPPVVSVLYPVSGSVSGVIIASASASGDTQRVVFEYSNDELNWLTLGTDFSADGGWNISFDTRDVSDTSTGRVRINATDGAGLSANATGGAFEIVNVAAAAVLFGTLSVNDSIVNDGSSILFTFSGHTLDLNVTLNTSEMQKLDSNANDLRLNDSGLNGDAAVDDAIYSGIYGISSDNTVGDGVNVLTAVVNDSSNNRFLANVTITLDNTAPNASIQVFGTSVAGFTNVSTEYAAMTL